MAHRLARSWWVLAVRGVAAIAFGTIALLLPGDALKALVILFGAYAFVDGGTSLLAAVLGKRHGRCWWTLILEGFAGIAAGILTFAWPGLTALILLFFIAGWAIALGVFEIVAAIRLRKEIQGEFWLGLCGFLSILFGAYLLIFPAAGALAVIMFIGAYAILFGVSLVMLAFRLRSWAKNPPPPAAA